MRQMRNLRTGKVAVYDADLVESGRWEEIRVGQTDEQPKQKASGPADEVAVSDEISIVLFKETEDESK